jgi:signal transduction histidine kinase
MLDWAAPLAHSDTPPAAESAPAPPPRLVRSLAARIAAWVLLVLVSTGTLAFVVLGQLRALQASFDLLTGVYVVFNQRLADAHVQAVRIDAEVRRNAEQVRLAPEAPRLDPMFLRNFAEALLERERLVREARAPIDNALQSPERFGGDKPIEDLRAIQTLLDELEHLVTVDSVIDPSAVLDDQRTENQVVQLFKSLASHSSRAIVQLQFEVREAQREARQLTLGLTLAAVIVGVLAAIGVVLTLRPLRRLSQRVRRLGRGDWSQRIEIAGRAGAGDEVSQLGREFNLMAEALEERERRLLRGERLAAAGQLAAKITHEIRNPLSSVALNAELLEDELEHASPEARALLAKITGEVDRLTATTEDYLSFARRSEPELSPVDVREEIERLLDFLAGEHEHAGIAVECTFRGPSAWVSGDANHLRQAFMNLLRNAREAVLDEDDRARGTPPRISIEVECKRGEVEVVVTDNGPGIMLPPDQVEQIFEAFYTRKARGTGLGLPIVQQIVQDHGGTVKVVRTGPTGTSFVVRLPACDPPGVSVSSSDSG